MNAEIERMLKVAGRRTTFDFTPPLKVGVNLKDFTMSVAPIRNKTVSVYCLNKGDKLVACAGVMHHNNKIAEVFVDKDYRGKGLAKFIVSYLLTNYKPSVNDTFNLVARPGLGSSLSLDELIGLYKSLGFEVSATEPTVVMEMSAQTYDCRYKNVTQHAQVVAKMSQEKHSNTPKNSNSDLTALANFVNVHVASGDDSESTQAVKAALTRLSLTLSTLREDARSFQYLADAGLPELSKQIAANLTTRNEAVLATTYYSLNWFTMLGMSLAAKTEIAQQLISLVEQYKDVTPNPYWKLIASQDAQILRSIRYVLTDDGSVLDNDGTVVQTPVYLST